ncbi:MAG: carbohydrate kinase family protein [Chloroflexota bacterium]
MPSLRPPRARRPLQRQVHRARIVVVGDLMMDVVLAPDRALESGSDVPGRVSLVQGGSAANTARWLARLGARSSLVCAVGRDAAGRALVDALRGDGVTPRVSRVAAARTGRIGVVVAPGGERSFVADRGAADLLVPDDLRPDWFRRADAVHLPVYSLLGEPLGQAGQRAVALAREAGALVSVDLASIVPLLSRGRRAARALIESTAPDLLFATAAEAEALLGRYSVEGLLDLAPVAVVKRGSKGATVMAREGEDRLRFEVATQHVNATDTTGAGDAFDAGFLVGWFAARKTGGSTTAALQRAALAGHRAATRQLTTARPELPLG